MRELDELQRHQSQWRGVLAWILGAAVGLVYGAIAVLEFRQNLFVGALLRSFGAPRHLLYLRHWLENVALANLAALTAAYLVVALHQFTFGSLGLPAQAVAAGQTALHSNEVTVSILLWINTGAFLSSLPVAAGLRQPEGQILN